MSRLVYVCHPWRSDPAGNAAALRAICAELTAAGDIPIAPPLYLSQWLNDENEIERGLALDMALQLLELCREMRVYRPHRVTTEGMHQEILRAHERRIPVRWMEQGDDDAG